MNGRIYRLKDLEEAVGTLSGLEVDEGHLIATVWKLRLLLPVDMEPILRPILGKKIGIIRVDSSYRARVITPTQNSLQSDVSVNIAENRARARADQTRANRHRSAIAKTPETRNSGASICTK